MKKYIVIVFICFSFVSKGQVIIVDNQPVIDMVKRLEGDGVLIENITYSFDLENAQLHSPIGNFIDTVGALAMRSGLLITNGAARNAVGPNDLSDADQINYPDIYLDDDLQSLIQVNQVLQDLVIVEFDITVYSNMLNFNYVFASEEYPEFLDFNDVFGFFLSGPGINGVENLAVVPGTSIPVSVSNINQNNNNQFFISNGTGDTPFDDINLQYDGYTVALRAERAVVPCETYHIKLAIADVDDSNLDSGVFLEDGSFSSKKLPYFDVFYENARFDHLIEGCNNAQINIVRDLQDLGQTAEFEILVEGTAIMGEDFDPIDLNYSFGADDLHQSFNINTILDTIPDGAESIKLTLISDCNKFDYFDIIEIDLKETFKMRLDDEKKCGPTPIELNSNYIKTDAYNWEENDLLSCFQCSSPYTDVLEDTVFNFKVFDSISGCEGSGEQGVVYEDLIADFSYINDYCKTSLDYDFTNLSTGADIFEWGFGDDNTSSDFNASHIFNAAKNKSEEVEFNVYLKVVNSETGCVNVKREVITINEPLLIPNVCTPNNDLINDLFTIGGINEDCWSISIYNRWGKLVLQESPFSNDLVLENLSDGTYFYLIKNDEGSREFKGTFNILK